VKQHHAGFIRRGEEVVREGGTKWTLLFGRKESNKCLQSLEIEENAKQILSIVPRGEQNNPDTKIFTIITTDHSSTSTTVISKELVTKFRNVLQIAVRTYKYSLNTSSWTEYFDLKTWDLGKCPDYSVSRERAKQISMPQAKK